MNKDPIFLEYLNENFTYKYDKNEYGVRDAWYVMKHVPYHGDCEDYSLTYLWNICGRSYVKMFFSLIFGKAKICFCRVRGEGHAVLRHNGDYLDNIQKKWCSKRYLEERGYVFHDKWFLWNVVAVKLLQGWYYAKRQRIEDS